MITSFLTILWIIYFFIYIIVIIWIVVKIIKNQSKIQSHKKTYFRLVLFFISLLTSYSTKSQTVTSLFSYYPFLINILIELSLFIHVVNISFNSKATRQFIQFLIISSTFSIPLLNYNYNLEISTNFEDYQLYYTLESIIASIALLFFTRELKEKIYLEKVFENPKTLIGMGVFIGLSVPVIYSLSGAIINFYALDDEKIIYFSKSNRLIFLYVATITQLGYLIMIIFVNRALNTSLNIVK